MAKLMHLGLLLGLISTAFALKCYKCDSSNDIACDIGALSFAQEVVDCNEGDGILNFIPKTCLKLTAKDEDNKDYVARGCGVNVGFNACELIAKAIGFMSTKVNVHDLHCYECDSDKCNGSVTIGSSMTILSVLVACILFLF